MHDLALRVLDEPSASCCPVCGQAHTCKQGPAPFLADCDQPVCRPCARKLDPNLAALIDLAHVADSVGRRCRHLLTPPMEALLDLARAAENYTHCAAAVAAHAR